MTFVNEDVPAEAPAAVRAAGIELNGLNTIEESERRGRSRDLFWPWFGANVGVFGLSYAAFLLGFGLSFWQATFIGVAGIIVSFLVCGFVSIAGKRGSAPTMVLSRAAFGVLGNRVPSALSWILTVGWEIVVISLGVLATSSVAGLMGVEDTTLVKVITLIVVIGLVIGGGMVGFSFIMKMQRVITIVTGVLTVTYIVLVFNQIDFAAVAATSPGNAAAMIGGFVFMATGYGFGWANAAADYSRYLPRSTRSGGVVGWTTFGSSLAPVILLVFGALLAASSADLSSAIGADPIGALAVLLPTWFLVPFVFVTLLGLIGAAVMDIYSSGLALMSAGLRVPRYVAVGIDGVLSTVGTIYVCFFASDFIGPFQGFLITLGVPVAVWAGIFLGDLAMRRKDYSDKDLYDPNGRYGKVRWLAISLMAIGTFVGWGLVTNFGSPFLAWQGYLLGPIGGVNGEWAYANLGVLVALVVGFVGTLVLGRGAVRRQEAVCEISTSETLTS